jgi:hypothetical protein
MEISEGEEREKGTEEIFEAIISENSPELTPDTKCRSRKLKGHQVRVNFPKKTILSYPNHRKLKDKENSLNKPEKSKPLCTAEQGSELHYLLRNCSCKKRVDEIFKVLERRKNINLEFGILPN